MKYQIVFDVECIQEHESGEFMGIRKWRGTSIDLYKSYKAAYDHGMKKLKAGTSWVRFAIIPVKEHHCDYSKLELDWIELACSSV
jgi:hypothetical protein